MTAMELLAAIERLKERRLREPYCDEFNVGSGYRCSLPRGHVGRHELWMLAVAWTVAPQPPGKTTPFRVCGDPCMHMNICCTLPSGHAGDHGCWVARVNTGAMRVASWPNTTTPQPPTPSPSQQPQAPDPDPPSPTGPDPDGKTAPDPGPKPIDYTEWISDEDLL